MAARSANGQDHRAGPGPFQRPQGRRQARLRTWRSITLAALLAGAAAAAPCADPPARIFDDAALAALLERIRDFNNVLQRGLEESTGELAQRLPGLWRDLATLEDRMQRKLPLLRERLEALERELREWSPPPRRAAPATGLIEV